MHGSKCRRKAAVIHIQNMWGSLIDVCLWPTNSETSVSKILSNWPSLQWTNVHVHERPMTHTRSLQSGTMAFRYIMVELDYSKRNRFALFIHCIVVLNRRMDTFQQGNSLEPEHRRDQNSPNNTSVKARLKASVRALQSVHPTQSICTKQIFECVFINCSHVVNHRIAHVPVSPVWNSGSSLQVRNALFVRLGLCEFGIHINIWVRNIAQSTHSTLRYSMSTYTFSKTHHLFEHYCRKQRHHRGSNTGGGFSRCLFNFV